MKSYVLLIIIVLTSCYKEQSIQVTANFDIQIENQYQTVPVQVSIINKTTGADNYLWTFEGAEPSTSNKQNPDILLYKNAGTYKIQLETWNADERKSKEITIQLDSAVNIQFTSEAISNNLSPAEFQFTNLSKGASTYKWTFEGGSPSVSVLRNPPAITFLSPGKHSVTLEISNGSQIFTQQQYVTVLAKSVTAFEFKPFFQNRDMEAPLNGYLINKSTNILSYKWICLGAQIETDTSSQILFPTDGTYQLILETWNGKATQTAQQLITVKPNSNLYTFQDIKLGVFSAQDEIGCYFSGSLGKTLRKSDVTSSSKIDFAFFSLNQNFDYCRLISPDSVAEYGFYNIPNASKTFTISSPVHQFTLHDFDTMTDYTPLLSINIPELNDNHLFDLNILPKLLLFETADQRKGAIKIKTVAKHGVNSYIICDIKVWKNKQKQ